jgi:predicted lipid-binding transport protein (Tim44 family)
MAMTGKGGWMVVLALVAAVLLAPALAEAKAGGGASMGSRGSRTFTPNGAAPIERSLTPPPSSNLGSQTPAGPAIQPAAPHRPFATGLMAGLLGVGMAGLLFGHHGFGLGGILTLVLLFFLGRQLLRMFAGGARPAVGAAQPRGPVPQPAVAFPLQERDLAGIEGLLAGIQAAWSRRDLDALRQQMTPEMAGYMAEQLSENDRRGVINHVDQVRLDKGDVNETWREGALEYATVTLAWSAIDVTVRLADNQVVAGDPHRPVSTVEIWTMVRRPGDNWRLSAIQQAA